MTSANNLSDVFVSYSRKDSEFVRRLDAALKKYKRDVWVDWEDIPLSADWWEEIKNGIEAANTFIFVITPDSAASEICYKEIDFAIHSNKRFVPVLHRAIDSVTLEGKLHKAISTHNWIFFRDEDNFDLAVEQLIRVLETDLDHVRMHTRLLLRAREWDERHRDSSFLLGATEIQEAEKWLAESGAKQPKPTALHTEYILQSRYAQTRRQRTLLIGVSMALIAAVVLTILSLFLFRQSQSNLTLAENNALTSDANYIIAQNNALTATFALDRAEAEAANALNQQGTAYARATEAFQNANEAATNAQVAANNANIAVVAQRRAETQAARATIAQGDALNQANIAETAQAIAYTQAAAATLAQGQALIEADNAQTQAANATIAQGQALIEADNAGTQAANAGTQAARATIAQGQALIEADNAQTQAANATIAQGQAQLEANNAQTQAANAGTQAARATLAQGEALIQAGNAQTQAVRATLAQGEAEQNLALAEERGTLVADQVTQVAAALATSEASEQIARAQALSVNAAQALAAGDTDLALPLALESLALNPDLIQTQSLLNRAVAISPLFVGARVALARLHPDSQSVLTLDESRRIITLSDIRTRAVIFQIPDQGVLINDVQFSADGSRLITAAADGSVVIWNSADGQLITRTAGHTGPALAIGISPDGRSFISAGSGPVLRYWHLSTGAEVRPILEANTNPIDRVAFGADSGNTLFTWTAGNNPIMSIWNLATGRIVNRYTFNYRGFSRDRRYAWTGGKLSPEYSGDPNVGVLQFWTAATAQQIRSINSGFDWDVEEVIFVDFSPDGKIMLVGVESGDQQRLVLLNTGNSQLIRSYDNAGLNIRSAMFAPVGEYAVPGQIETPPGSNSFITLESDLVLSTTVDNRLILWSVSTGRLVRQIGVDDRSMEILGFSADGQYALTYASDNSARIWSTLPLTTEIGEFEKLRAISPDGSLAVLTDNLFSQMVYRVSDNTRLQSMGRHQDQITAGAFSPDGSIYLSGDESGITIQWNTSDWREYDRINLQAPILDITYSADSTLAIVRTATRTTLWRVSDGTVLYEVRSPGYLSAGGTQFTYYASNQLVTVALADRTEISRYDIPPVTNSIERLSEDGTLFTRLITLSRDQVSEVTGRYTVQLQVYDLTNGTLIREITMPDMVGLATAHPLYGESNYPFAFSPDGRLLLLSNPDTSLQLYDLTTLEPVIRYVGHNTPAVQLAFSPDGTTALSTSLDGTFILWDVLAGTEIRRFVRPPADEDELALFYELTFTTQGNIAVYGSPERSTLWQLDSLEAIGAWTRANRAVGELTCNQRRQYNTSLQCDTNGVLPSATPAD